MRSGKATIVLASIFCMVHGLGWAQGLSDFEALLDEISSEPAADVVVAPVAPVVEEEPQQELGFDEETAVEVEVPAVEVEEEPEMVPPAMVDEDPFLEEVPVDEVPVEIAPVEVAPVEVDAFEASAEDPLFVEEPIRMAPVAAPEWEEEAVEPVEEVVEEVPADEPPAIVAPKVPAKPTAEAKKAAALAAQQEEVRRQAKEAQGLKNLEEGYRLLAAGDFPNALKQFEEAMKNLPDRPQNQEARARARWGNAESEFRIASDYYRRRENLAEARLSCERALRMVPEHTGAAALLKRITRLEEVLAQPVPPKKRPDVVEKSKKVDELIREGRQYFDLEDYNRAELLFERVLIEDQYNTDAMRYLKRIEDRRFKISSTERDATTANMIRQVRDAWNPPTREEVVLPEDVIRGAVVQPKTPAQRLQDKMTRIMIPSIEFRQANIVDVVNFLVEASRAGDEEGTGVNIILNLSVPGQDAAPAPSAPMPATDPFGFPAAGGGFDDFFGETPTATAAPSMGATPMTRTITLNLRRISLLDAVKYITEVAGLKFRVEDNAVIITPAGVVSGRVVTRMYPVQPSIVDVIVEREETAEKGRTGDFIEMGGGRTTFKRGDVKDFFEKAGVPFPVGTSITYNQAISQLIVANTPENLDIFERILANLNVVPNQVEIEARFVEVSQNDMEELGLQWILTDNWEVATKQGGGFVGNQERIDVLADPDGLTKGNRFFAFDRTTAAIDPASPVTLGANQSPLGGILSVASVLTNPEVKMILHALSQRGNSDLLSAPRITTRSGVNATIQVVREIIYPTEFEVTQPTIQSEGNLVTPPTVTPGSFETREVGVILNVTPTVGPDGYTIDLTMVPEVAELVDWIQYGSEVTISSPIQNPLTGLLIGSRENRFRYNIPQPVFSSRNATTSIVIWDGQTVVMGGLIREELVTYKDKVPLLGDIPILGRLFRSEGQRSRKTNLLIFVTARLVDPAGKPIHKAETMTMPGGARPADVVAAQ
jgi:general secretion pathway protein D